MCDAYDKIFEALIDTGYSEQEAEILLYQVIQEQKDIDDFRDNIHQILKEYKSTIN